jgi:hypothetical protein
MRSKSAAKLVNPFITLAPDAAICYYQNPQLS